MCVAFFTLEHPDYALVLGSNRDEFLARPSQPACFHAFEGGTRPTILSGIDVQGGGTWLGLSRGGRLALLTNITEPFHTFSTSRGHLVSSFLSSSQQDVQTLVHPDARYAGFNLLLLTPAATPHFSFDAHYVTNHGAGGPIVYRALPDTRRHRGALSNGIDGNGADEWPKVQHGLHAFSLLLDTLAPHTSDDQLAERLFDLLAWRSPEPPRDRSELRNTIQVDPLQLENEAYGTRLSTVVLVKRSGEVVFIERDRWELSTHGRPILADRCSQRVFRFRLESNALSI